MDGKNRRNHMAVNLSNVFSPKRRIHASEQLWDVDFTEIGNPMVEQHYDNAYSGKGEKDGVEGINRDNSLM